MTDGNTAATRGAANGARHNEGKPRWGLLPWDGLLTCVQVLEAGARKYADRNWERGLQWVETSECLIRHLTAWLQGEDRDDESGLDHTAHVLCNALFLATMVVRGHGEDNRPKRPCCERDTDSDGNCDRHLSASTLRMAAVVNRGAVADRLLSTRKKIVYVAGPFRGSDSFAIAENIRSAERLALQVWQAGGVAICPHLNTMHFQGAAPDEIWLDGDLDLLRRSDAILMCAGWEKSSGSIGELELAQALELPEFYGIGGTIGSELTDWLAGDDKASSEADALDPARTDACYLCGREQSSDNLYVWGRYSRPGIDEVTVCDDDSSCHQDLDVDATDTEIDRLLAGKPRRALGSDGLLEIPS